MNGHTEPLRCGIPFAKLQDALTAGKLRFTQLKDRHPGLKGYLVLCAPSGQIDIDVDLPRMLEDLPDLFLDNAVKTQARDLVRELRLVEKKKDEAETEQRPALQKRIEVLNECIRNMSRNFAVNGSCPIEIRFHHLNYPLIWKLQADDLIDRELTPQSRASIRIVLGTLSRIANLSP